MNMSNSTTEYITQAIDPAVLSVLDVELDGKVVSAQDWKTLWQLVFNRINRIDAFCLEVEDLRVSLEQSRQEMFDAAHHIDVKYAALEQSFVHYGTEAPANVHVKLWIQPVSNVPAYLFVTGAELNRQLDIQTETMQEAYQQYVDDAVAAGKDVLQEYVDDAIDTLADDVAYLSTHAATKQYVDDAITGITDWTTGADEDISNLLNRTETLETKTNYLPELTNDVLDLTQDIQNINQNYATKQYVDDAVASVSGGVSQEYVDNAIAGVKDIADNNESDIEVIRQQTGTLQNKVQGLEDDVDALKQSSVTIGYVQETYATKNEMASLEDDIGYIHEHYATKQYVDDAVASSGGGTGGGVSSWNDLTDKPFYDEGIKTATLDYANPPAVGIDFDGVFLGKVADDILTADYINGAKLSLSFTTDGTVESISEVLNIDTLMVFPFPVGTVYQLNGDNFFCMIVVATQTGEFDLFGDGGLITVPETGTYLSFVHYSAVTKSISLTYNLIKTLEAKYLEIINKIEDVSILTEQEFSFTDDGNGMYQAILDAIPLTAGNEYKVLWDGTEYVYEAMNMDGAIMIGDFLAANPFVIGLVEGTAMIATSSTSATHTIAITEVGTCEIKQEYLPASLYTAIDQRIEDYINEALGGEY